MIPTLCDVIVDNLPALKKGRDSYEGPMILITGATGNIGAELVKRLSGGRQSVRAFVRSRTHAKTIQLNWWRAILPNRRHSRPPWKM